jgi:hypothetical protein
VPAALTEITELATALGMTSSSLDAGIRRRPGALRVPDDAWRRLQAAHDAGDHSASFQTAFANGQAFLHAADGLRGRPPRLVEWRGPHRPPGDDVIPADLRIDHVYLVSCKYLSKVLLNASPSRLFDRALVGDERQGSNWFNDTAPAEIAALYASAVDWSGLDLPERYADLTRDQQQALRAALPSRSLPEPLRPMWADLSARVAAESAARWSAALGNPRARLRLLWRMLRVSSTAYFVLGTSKDQHLRMRIASQWDWMQDHELRELSVAPRLAGQPEVAWTATVRPRCGGAEQLVRGHVEIRWSHGRFVGAPEAKVYLDTPYDHVPGIHHLDDGDGQMALSLPPTR